MLPAAPFRPQRADWIRAGSASAVLLAIYAATSSRTVALEDDGLFILAAYFMGGAHPPGYPLFVLIGKLFTYLPLGSVAYRVHLASAFFGALTCGALWLCARALGTGRLAAWLAALGLGLSPVFWSQAIIAEVYTLNTFFFATLTLLALCACPPGAGTPAERSRLLPWIALLYGLSLSNHWPLMGLATPALAILLWPRRMEILRRLPLLVGVSLLGLLPYVWMVVASLWSWQPISYHGPLLTLSEVWHVLSRAGYTDTDNSVSAGWIDRLRFFQFQGEQAMLQLAVAGSLLAAVGAAVQRRAVGGRVALFLVLAFVMPTFVLLLLLNFDYDTVTKHIFHVYPLPAYAVLALWMALGFEHLRERYRLGSRGAAGAAGVILALVAALGARTNLPGESWGVRYAQAVLRTLPKDAVLFVKGDVDLAPIGYFYLVEHQRPDIELYHVSARVLGNRLFPPLRTTHDQAQKAIGEFIDSKDVPVAFTLDFWGGYAHRDRWLYVEVDKSSRDSDKSTIDVPQEALRFFEESVATSHDSNAWVAFHQDELRRRYGTLIGHQLPRAGQLDERLRRHLLLLSEDYFGLIGLVQGVMGSPQGYTTGVVLDLLERARVRMPPDATKAHKASFFHLRGLLRLDMGDKAGATADLLTAVEVWPRSNNLALKPLRDLYQVAGDKAALEALESRMKRRR
jgi:hypothetical protein